MEYRLGMMEDIDAIYVISNETAYILHGSCVAPAFQNKFLGKQLLLKIESQIRDMGYRSVRLDVFEENPYAQKLYHHNGYEVCGYADWRKGQWKKNYDHLIQTS